MTYAFVWVIAIALGYAIISLASRLSI
jgi:hypothetical protein